MRIFFIFFIDERSESVGVRIRNSMQSALVRSQEFVGSGIFARSSSCSSVLKVVMGFSLSRS
jgi:hypothetical protein